MIEKTQELHLFLLMLYNTICTAGTKEEHTTTPGKKEIIEK